MTPASSLSNIAAAQQETTEEAMDVEMTSEENKDTMNPPIGCDNEAVSNVAEDTGPCPKHVTDAELGVLQVKQNLLVLRNKK